MALDGRAGRDAYLSAHLVGQDAGKGGLAEAGRSVEEDMIQGLAPLLGGGERDAEILLDLVLPYILCEVARPKGGLDGSFFATGLGGKNSFIRHIDIAILY